MTEEEMIEIANFRGMALEAFADSYVRAASGRLSLQDRLIDGEYICCMFDIYDKKCTIYEHRPSQCRTFPFWEGNQNKYLDLMEFCPGILIKK